MTQSRDTLTRLPVIGWLSLYRREWLRDDVAAGLTASPVIIPKAMAYAAMAGLSVDAGLYTALVSMLVYPLLGGSRALSVSTTSSIAVLTAGAVTAVSGPAADAAAVASTLAVLVGGALIGARLLRLGFIADFLSKPLLVGFQAGVGVVIIIGQLKTILGLPLTSTTSLGILAELPTVLPRAHGMTALAAALGVALLVGLPRVAPRVPAPLIWIALGIIGSLTLPLETVGIELVGAIPGGLPQLALPDFALVRSLWPAALGIALMSFIESVAVARTFCKRDDAPIGVNRELLAIGAANVAAAFVGGIPAGGGASQTAVVDALGARSQMAQWVCAAAVLATLLFLSPLIRLLPEVVLSAMIIVYAGSMIHPEKFRAIASIRWLELTWAVATFAGVVLIGTLQGIVVAVIISVVTLLYRANHPPVYVVAYNRAKDVFRRAGEDDAAETFPGLLILRTEGRINFANAANVGAKMRRLVDAASPRVIVLESSAVPDIEYTALEMLTEAEERLRASGVSLWLAGLNPSVQRILERSPLGRALGRERMFPDLRHALEAWQNRRS